MISAFFIRKKCLLQILQTLGSIIYAVLQGRNVCSTKRNPQKHTPRRGG